MNYTEKEIKNRKSTYTKLSKKITLDELKEFKNKEITDYKISKEYDLSYAMVKKIRLNLEHYIDIFETHSPSEINILDTLKENKSRTRQLTLHLTDREFKNFNEYAKRENKSKREILNTYVKRLIATPLSEVAEILNIDLNTDLSEYKLEKIDVTKSNTSITIIHTNEACTDTITITEMNNSINKTNILTIISHTKYVDGNTIMSKGDCIYTKMEEENESNIHKILSGMDIDKKITRRVPKIRKIKK